MVYLSDEELPEYIITDDTEDAVPYTYFFVPYTRVLPSDETGPTIPFTTADLVRGTVCVCMCVHVCGLIFLAFAAMIS